MASLFKQNKSKFWWIKWRNPTTRRIERFSTGLADSPSNRAKAIHLKNQMALKESAAPPRGQHPFASWVDGFLRAEYLNSPSTLGRYLGVWQTVASYFHAIQVSSPEQVSREHCFNYIAWRRGLPHLNNHSQGGRPVCNNTILFELKVLSRVMSEAVKRGFTPFNVCFRLGIKRAAPRVKAEISGEHLQIILQEIARQKKRASTPQETAEAEFLQHSFEIARLQGIRLRETYINLEMDVCWEQRTATIHGKGNRDFEANLNPRLFAFLLRLKQQGKMFPYQKPRHPSMVWFRFFRALRKKHPELSKVSFHSTRVSVISQLERAGAPEAITMRLVGHASTTVHRVYRRIKHEELAPYWGAVSCVDTPAPCERQDASSTNPVPAAPKSASREKRQSRPASSRTHTGATAQGPTPIVRR